MSEKESRIELLEMMFSKYIKGVKQMDDVPSILFTQPLIDNLVLIIHDLEAHLENKKTDELLNKIVNSNETDKE